MGIEIKENFTQILDLSVTVKAQKMICQQILQNSTLIAVGKLLLFYNSHFSHFFENSKSE
jgi:hypothetical protein